MFVIPEACISVRLGFAKPVAHALGVRLIHVGDDAEHLPAVGMLAFEGGVEYDAQGIQVVYAIDVDMLFLHLLPDGVY